MTNLYQSSTTDIVNAETGDTLLQEYHFVNIIGWASGVDLDESEHSPIGDTFYFHEMKLNIHNDDGLPIFRLKESPFEVIVNESVAEVIMKGSFIGLDVVEII